MLICLSPQMQSALQASFHFGLWSSFLSSSCYVCHQYSFQYVLFVPSRQMPTPFQSFFYNFLDACVTLVVHQRGSSIVSSKKTNIHFSLQITSPWSYGLPLVNMIYVIYSSDRIALCSKYMVNILPFFCGLDQGFIQTKLLPVTHLLVDPWMLTVKPVYKL